MSIMLLSPFQSRHIARTLRSIHDKSPTVNVFPWLALTLTAHRVKREGIEGSSTEKHASPSDDALRPDRHDGD